MNYLTNYLKKAVLTLALMLATAAGVWAINWSGTQTFNASQTIYDDITLTGNVTINVASGFRVIISGKISGGYSLTKTGAGYLYFTGANTYSGGTTVSAGYLY